MTPTMGWLLAALALGSFLAKAFIGNWVSEEVRGQLDRLPFKLVRLAARRLPADVQDDYADEWIAELHDILHDTDGIPITRFYRGAQYALDLLRAVVAISREISTVSPIAIKRSRLIRRFIPVLVTNYMYGIPIATWLRVTDAPFTWHIAFVAIPVTISMAVTAKFLYEYCELEVVLSGPLSIRDLANIWRQ